MDAENIIQELNRRFTAPLPEFYKRRIIFWHDEEREFADQLELIRLDNVKLVELTGSNTFAVKKLLCADDLNSNFLVYDPRSFSRDDDNWLVNVELYSEEFRADRNSIWIREMGLSNTPEIRRQVKVYRKFFMEEPNRSAVSRNSKSIATAPQMHLAVMAALCNLHDMEPAGILRAVLCAGLEKESNRVYQRLVQYGADTAFWALAARFTGYSPVDEPELKALAIHTLLTAASRTMTSECLAGLDAYYSAPHQSYCYDLVSDWMRSSDNGALYNVARDVERMTRLWQRFSKLPVEALEDTECFPCIDECILSALMTEICEHELIQPERIRSTVEKRRSSAWYEKVEPYYEGLLQLGNMQGFYLEHADGFHVVEPEKLWHCYTTDYYRMDSYYRQFHLSFQRSLEASNPLLDDLFKHIAENAEGLYSHWFLDQLGANWSDACAQELADYGCIRGLPQQTDFYRNRIRNSNNRAYVIISDALRYEVAASLVDRLRLETQCKVELDSCEGIFPTITKFGMAALLPHRELSVKETSAGDLAILADGQSTEAPARDRCLKAANKASVALKYEDLVQMKRAERQALVKGMDVVYIYHNMIDEASHISDMMVFPACENAIRQIMTMIRSIVSDFGGTTIYITADHGFLYTYEPLKESAKVDKDASGDLTVEYDRRYMITCSGVEPMHLLPVKFMDGKTDYSAFTPRENTRIKKSGSGLNFVHGGISLQEIVVPIVEYQFLRNANKTYQRHKDSFDTKPVTLSLISASRKISNMIFSLNLFQQEPVGGIREAASYLLYFTDSNGKQISDTCKIIADKTSSNEQERIFRAGFNLKSLKYSGLDTYYLVIADESGLQAPQRIEFQIDIAFAVDEFDFF